MMAYELAMARSGALDTDLLAQRQFYGTDFTKPLLFIADGGYYATLASNMHLTGDQWGVMNETGSYPGQPWLWLYQMWYHVSPFQSSASVDIWAVYLTGIGHPAAAPGPVHPRAAGHPAVDPGAPADLADPRRAGWSPGPPGTMTGSPAREAPVTTERELAELPKD